MARNNILICTPTKNSIHKISKIMDEKTFKWAYLGEDVSNTSAITKLIGADGERLDIAEMLQQTACLARQQYIDYIGKLSAENNSMVWWAGSLSEKNPFVSKTFQYFCYIKVSLSLIESHRQNNLVFFVESRNLRLALMSNIPERGEKHVYHIEPALSNIRESMKDGIEFIIKSSWFLLNNVYRVFLTKHIYRLNGSNALKLDESGNGFGKDLFLIHTWVDHRSFNEDGTFRDAYFGKLKDVMKSKGKNVVIVPYVLHTVPYGDTIKKLISCDEDFLIPSAYLKISDVLKVLKLTFKKPENISNPTLENIGISYLIYNDNINDWKDMRLMSNLLSYYLVRNLKELGVPIEQFTYTYENHTWEKVYCAAFREFYPSTRILGYQHAAISKMYLNYFMSEHEFDIVPSPDVVLTTGNHSANMLIRSGYDPGKIISSGAIRYEYLTRILNQNVIPEKNKRNDSTKPNIVVTTSIDKNESSELILKAIGAFGSLDTYNVILKCHPVMPYEQVVADLNMGPLPKHFTVSDKTMSTLLNGCDLLLYTSSTTGIEALAVGLPVLHIGSSFIIDRDVLDSLPNIRTSVKTEEDIRIKSKDLLETYQDVSPEQKVEVKNMVKNVFGTVDDAVFGLFIEK